MMIQGFEVGGPDIVDPEHACIVDPCGCYMLCRHVWVCFCMFCVCYVYVL